MDNSELSITILIKMTKTTSSYNNDQYLIEIISKAWKPN